MGQKTIRWDWIGAGVGLLIGAMDYFILRLVGVVMTLGGHDMSALVVGFFALTFAALGFVNGRLMMARTRAKDDAETIAEQLEALERSQQELVQAEKLAAIGRLAAGVAHEVRNPLGVIRASASLIQEDAEEASDDHRACTFIVEEIDRLEAMISALLKFSRPERLDRRFCQTLDCLERALVLAQPALDERGAVLERDLRLDKAHALMADADLLSQVVYGLLVNAVEALDGPPLTVAVRAWSDAGVLCVEVADSGPGIDAKDAQVIFEPFFTTKARGTGLGLAIAAQIAEAHGGTLSALQAKGAGPAGQGACLRLMIPEQEEPVSS